MRHLSRLLVALTAGMAMLGGFLVATPAAQAAPTISSMSEADRHINDGQRVKALELLLAYRGHLGESQIDADFTSRDGDVTAQWQEDHDGLDVDRIAGHETVLSLAPTLGASDKNAAVTALQTLLAYHGFDPGAADGSFGDNTQSALNQFLEAAGSSHRDSVGDGSWTLLFQKQGSFSGGGDSAADRAVPLSQLETGEDSGMNCGPTSLVNSLIALGETPDGWTGDASERSAAVQDMRATIEANGSSGTNLAEIVNGLNAYGIDHQSQYANGNSDLSAYDAALAAVESDDENIAILHGSAGYFGSASNGHWVAIVGHDSDSGNYLMIDPATTQDSQELRQVSRAELDEYGLSYGPPNAAWTE